MAGRSKGIASGCVCLRFFFDFRPDVQSLSLLCLVTLTPLCLRAIVSRRARACVCLCAVLTAHAPSSSSLLLSHTRTVTFEKAAMLCRRSTAVTLRLRSFKLKLAASKMTRRPPRVHALSPPPVIHLVRPTPCHVQEFAVIA